MSEVYVRFYVLFLRVFVTYHVNLPKQSVALTSKTKTDERITVITKDTGTCGLEYNQAEE